MQKLLVIALFTFALVAATEVQDEATIIAKIHNLYESQFGKYVFEIVMVELESGDTLGHLLETLHKLEDRYAAEQKEDDSYNRQFQEVCDGDIADYDKDLANSNQNKIALEAKLEGELHPLRAVHQGVEKSKLNEIKQYKQELDELDKDRFEENQLFEEKVKEYSEAMDIIRQAKVLFEDNLLKPSLVEIKKHGDFLRVNPEALTQIKEHLGKSILFVEKHGKVKKSYASMFKVLLTIMSQAESTADQGSVKRIIQLCAELLDKVSDSLDLERFAEDKRVAAWQKHRTLIQRDLNVALSILANIQATLASIEDQIHTVEGSLETTNQRIETVSQQRHDRYTECEQDAYDYQQRRTKRDQQRATVSDIIGLVNANLRTLKEQIALRQAAGEDI